MDVRFSLGTADPLGEDEVVGIAVSGDLGRDGDIWVPQGIDLTEYRRNPVVLRDHRPDRVVGSAVAIGFDSNSNSIGVRIRFAPPGTSDIADETRALAKAGVLRGISAGVEPITVEPIDPKRPYAGLRVLKAELLEVSVVAIPADTGALITQRSFAARPGAAAMLRTLPTVAPSAIERAFSFARVAPVPFASLTPNQQAELDRRRTLTAYALGRAEAERFGYAQRQQELTALTRNY